MRFSFVLLALLIGVTPAAAQSTYVGGSLIGELARFGKFEVEDDGSRSPSLSLIVPTIEPLSRDGESLGFDVRVGRALGDRWGLELTVARGGTHEHRRTARSIAFPTEIVTIPTLPGVTPTLPTLPIRPIPDFAFEVVSRQQHLTVDTVAWLRQELNDRFQLVFLAGVSFNQIETEQEVTLNDNRLAIYLPFPREIETTQYDVGPLIGTETVIGLSERLAVTGGVRMHVVNAGGLDGWLVRPAVGIRWRF